MARSRISVDHVAQLGARGSLHLTAGLQVDLHGRVRRLAEARATRRPRVRRGQRVRRRGPVPDLAHFQVVRGGRRGRRGAVGRRRRRRRRGGGEASPKLFRSMCKVAGLSVAAKTILEPHAELLLVAGVTLQGRGASALAAWALGRGLRRAAAARVRRLPDAILLRIVRGGGRQRGGNRRGFGGVGGQLGLGRCPGVGRRSGRRDHGVRLAAEGNAGRAMREGGEPSQAGRGRKAGR
mmetsp:Transcript_74205/g.194620  ORF Transcript_74205/g.194620 Transcript_74205/m.194620 type:complete len:237 (+) Transcript_74205:1315-2025(+)